MNRVSGVLVLVVVGSVLVGSVAHGNPIHIGRYHPNPTVIRGVQCRITTSPLPDLQGGEFSGAWCMVSTAGGDRWAQTFYGRTVWRNHPNELEVGAQYIDVNGQDYFVWPNPPIFLTPGNVHRYEARQNGATGQWTFSWGGVQFGDSGNRDTRWAGTWAEFAGEVLPNSGVSMVGTAANRVRFSEFRIFAPGPPGQPPSWLDIWPSIAVDNNNDWVLVTDPNQKYFEIYDTTP